MKIQKEQKMKIQQIQTVNEAGLNQIKKFLAAHHKKGGDHFTPEMLHAWASDAEFSLMKGNGADIEIRAWDSINNCTETFTISPEGLGYLAKSNSSNF